LHEQSSRVVVEGLLDALDPGHLGVSCGNLGVVRFRDVNLVAAVVFGDVARGVGVAQKLADAAAGWAHADHSDARPNIEDPAVPRESEVANSIKEALTPVRTIRNRALCEEHPELVTAEPGDEITGVEGIGKDSRELPEHGVACGVTTGVVDDLEVVEIEVAQGEPLLAEVRGFDCGLEPALELASVDEAGQRIMCGKVCHFTFQAANLRDILKNQDSTH
jgi:hypothetical protein